MEALPTVLAHNGNLINIDDLPSASMKRWSPSRKANVVYAVRGGLITVDGVCEKYGLSLEEYYSWERTVVSVGTKGLTLRLRQEARHAN